MKKFYLFLLLLTLNSTILFAQIFVTEAGAGLKNGFDWANAYDNTQLQQAINEAENATVKQVWVAKGIYKPTEILSGSVYTTSTGAITSTTSDSDKAFILKDGVTIYGGFAGGESSVNDRTNISTTNETILSGDLNNDNTANAGDAYHVVAARNDADGAVLDGFTIQHGYGNNSDYSEIEGGSRIRRNIGAAIAVSSNKVVSFKNLVVKNNQTTNAGGAVYTIAKHGDTKFYFTNVRFEDNSATGTGGAIYATAELGASQLNITDCFFQNNRGGGGTGAGALYFAGESNDAILNIINSHFEKNEARHTAITYGGALRLNTGVTNLLNTVFKENEVGGTADGRGGAIYSTGGATVNSNGCTFDKNSSTADGGHWTVFSGITTITNSTFTNGNASTEGGAFYVATAGTLNISSSSRFIGNTAGTLGGAIYQTGTTSVLDVRFSTFENNIANSTTSTGGGGAIYFYTGTATIVGCTFKANQAANGGALINLASTVNIDKTRFYSNTANNNAGAFYIYSGGSISSTTTILNSIFYDNYSKTTSTGAAGGGAIYQTRQTSGTIGTATVINSVFYANKSVKENAGYSFNSIADVKINLYNNIFSGNLPNYDELTQASTSSSTSADIRRQTGATQVIKNNILQSSLNDGVSGNRTVINAFVPGGGDVIFSSDTPTPSDTDFLYPANNSFAKDKGELLPLPTPVSSVPEDDPGYSAYQKYLADVAFVNSFNNGTDLLGNPRVEGTKIDLGPIEWSTVLPVTVSSFTANLANNRTQLKWSVGTEENVNRYEVERSQTGTDFTKVAEVSANGSANYQTVDANPQIGVNYYRLKTIDNDGSHSYYGQIESVKVNSLSAEGIKIHPNPVKDGNVNVLLTGYTTGEYGYKLLNTSGSVVQQGTLNHNGSSISLSLLPSISKGLYILQLNNGANIKLIKQ